MRAPNAVKGRYYQFAGIVLLIVFLVSFYLITINLWERSNKAFPTQQPVDETLEYNGIKYDLKDNIETFVVIGLDKMSDGEEDSDAFRNDKQADFIMVFVLDNASQTITPIQINRDTMVEMNLLSLNGNPYATATKQIALSFNEGNGKKISCRNTLDAVSTLLLGMKMNHYIAVTMDGVPVYNDLVGGVTLEVLDDFSSIDASLVKGETVTLKGRQSLTYVRTRQGVGDETNVSRMARQRQYLNGLHEATVTKLKDDDAFAAELTTKMSEYIISDRSVSRLQVLLEKFSSYSFNETLVLEGENKVGEKFMEFYPTKDSVLKTVIAAFYRESGK